MVNLFAADNDYDYVCSRKMKAVRPGLLEVCLPHSKHHNVLQTMINSQSARLFFKMALARNDTAIRLVSTITKVYGIYGVRRIRKLFGFV